ncbi:MAG: hypothetical protein AB7P03_25125 [Kofleriaceae bacterium]
MHGSSSVALMTSSGTRSRASYMLVVAGHPTSWLTMIAGFGAAIALSSVIFAGLVLLAVLTGSVIAAGCPSVQRAVETKRRNDDRCKRRCKREDRVERANVDRTELCHLTNLVSDVDRASASDVDRFELDNLLDRYADLAIAHARCRDTLRSVDRAAIARELELEISREICNGTSSQHRKLLERQLTWWDRYKVQAEQLRDEMTSIAELIKLFALRAAQPQVWADGYEIETRLSQLDDEEAATRQLDNV